MGQPVPLDPQHSTMPAKGAGWMNPARGASHQKVFTGHWLSLVSLIQKTYSFYVGMEAGKPKDRSARCESPFDLHAYFRAYDARASHPAFRTTPTTSLPSPTLA